MMMLEFKVNKQKIERCDNNAPIGYSQNYLYAKFSFSSDWGTGKKRALFSHGKNKQEWEAKIDASGMCLVPHEVIKDGVMHIRVEHDTENSQNSVPHITTNYVNVMIRVEFSVSDTDIVPGTPATRIYFQFKEHMESKDNPHNVTANQVNAFTKEEVNDLVGKSKVEVVQSTGASETAVMSQKAVTEELNDKPGKTFDGGEIFGDIDSCYVGTKGFSITGFNGTHDGEGYYVIDGSEEDATKIKAFLKTEDLWVSINNDMWADSYSKITGVSYSEDGIMLETDCVYTNQSSAEYDGNEYSEKEQKGTPWTDFPELGWSIANGCAYLFINNHPELGTIQLCKGAVSFGSENISQGDTSLNSGYGNRTYGRFAHNFGRGLKSGYATTNIGRNNDARWAQNSLIAGIGHKVITRLLNAVTMIGAHLIASNHYQVVMGVCNRGKKNNVLELGRGKNTNERFNLLEVDEEGLLSTNEKLFPGQVIYEGSLKCGTLTNVLTNVSSQVYLDKPSTLDEVYSADGIAYSGYLQLKSSEMGLKHGKLYALCVEMNISSGTEIDKINVEELINTKVNRKFTKQLSLGKNNLIFLFNADSSVSQHGFVIHCPNGSSMSFSYGNMRLYEIPNASLNDNRISYVTCTGIETVTLDMKKITYSHTISEDLSKMFAICIETSLYFVGEGTQTYNGTIYSCDKNVSEGYNRAVRSCSKEETSALLEEKANKDHIHYAAGKSTDGFMSAADKGKLDGIDDGANKVEIVQTTGDSETAVMSQKAVTEELNGKADVEISGSESVDLTYCGGVYDEKQKAYKFEKYEEIHKHVIYENLLEPKHIVIRINPDGAESVKTILIVDGEEIAYLGANAKFEKSIVVNKSLIIEGYKFFAAIIENPDLSINGITVATSDYVAKQLEKKADYVGAIDFSTDAELGIVSGNLFDDNKAQNKDYFRIRGVKELDSDGYKTVSPDTIYEKPLDKYFGYLSVSGSSLDNDSYYMLSYDMKVLNADNPEKIIVGALRNANSATKETFNGVKFEVGKTHHFYYVFKTSENYSHYGIYHYYAGAYDDVKNAICQFKILNPCLTKLYKRDEEILKDITYGLTDADKTIMFADNVLHKGVLSDSGEPRTYNKILFDTSIPDYIICKEIDTGDYYMARTSTSNRIENLYSLSKPNYIRMKNTESKLDVIEEEANKVEIVHTIGTSETAVMSQKAVTEQLEKKANSVHGHKLAHYQPRTGEYGDVSELFDVDGFMSAADKGKLDGIEEGANKTEIVQTTGDSETAVMSQKAVTEELNAIKTALEEIIAIQNTLMGGAE